MQIRLMGSRIGLVSALLAFGAACMPTAPPEDPRPGSGGAQVGTGGAPGSGGAQVGTGGAPGSGGAQVGTGGAPGSGGAGGRGGQTTGTGGSAATGGAGGRGGTGGGSQGGAAGTGGRGGGGAGTGGTPGMGSCTNNRRDGSETGIDCGGSCAACPNYKINSPNRMNMAQSGCQGGQGFMCVRSMLLSPELKQAASEDWGNADDPPFVYGTVGHDADTGGLDNGNTCCQCYQLVFESPIGATGLPIPKPMIVQSFNTAAGGGKKFDIFMATGGYGANNGCVAGGRQYDAFPDLGGDYSGGVRASRYSQCSQMGQWNASSIGSQMCQSYIESQCTMIRSSAASVQSTSQASCMQSNYVENHYHINWNVRAKRIECPTNLTRVTGCKLNNQGLPQANPDARTAATADSSFRTGYGTTTMQDCCRPTCAYPNNVQNADGAWPIFYTCDKAGNPQ
jgi:hypothetical protein